jgi:pimeloyl-ACP methyl ester carboxylesterase
MNSILLLHGAIGCAQQLAPLKAALEKSGREILSLNFSGHGGAPFSKAGFGIESFADEIMTFLNANNIAFVDVFGYSMGGYAALYAGMQWPSRIRKIAVLGTKFDWSPDVARVEVRKLNPEKILEKVPVFAEQLKQMHAPQNWKTLLQETSNMMIGLGQKPLLNDNSLNAVQQEVLILAGDKDTMANALFAETAAQQIPNASFQLLENTPHPLEKVDHETLSRILINFFR